jgi:ATP adenylyltransferase
MEYIRQVGAPKACIFCEPDPPVGDRARLILHRGEHVMVLLNRYPYAPGHLMIAPYAHSAQLEDLEPAAQAELMTRLGEAAAIVRKQYACEGMNVGANLGRVAGAGFAEHLHFHLVPRWEGDHNFMTVVSEIRVIPTHLERIWDELQPPFAELGAS